MFPCHWQYFIFPEDGFWKLCTWLVPHLSSLEASGMLWTDRQASQGIQNIPDLIPGFPGFAWLFFWSSGFVSDQLLCSRTFLIINCFQYLSSSNTLVKSVGNWSFMWFLYNFSQSQRSACLSTFFSHWLLKHYLCTYMTVYGISYDNSTAKHVAFRYWQNVDQWPFSSLSLSISRTMQIVSTTYIIMSIVQPACRGDSRDQGGLVGIREVLQVRVGRFSRID